MMNFGLWGVLVVCFQFACLVWSVCCIVVSCVDLIVIGLVLNGLLCACCVVFVLRLRIDFSFICVSIAVLELFTMVFVWSVLFVVGWIVGCL